MARSTVSTDDGSKRADSETGLSKAGVIKGFLSCKRLFAVLNHCLKEKS
jgi:hypothetical protein